MKSTLPDGPGSTGVESAVKTSPSILLVTRHAEFAGEVSRQLAAFDYTVHVHSRETLHQTSWSRENAPDVALVDFEMDRTGAAPLHQAIRRTLPNCHLVLVCTLKQARHAARFMKAGEVREYVLADSAGDEHRVPRLVQQVCNGRYPSAKPAQSEAAHNDKLAEEHPPAKRRVLIVEDDPVSMELASWILERHGFAVSVAETAERAKQHLNRQPPDLVLMDVHIGHVSGVKLVAALRNGTCCPDPTVPVIVVTADRTRGTLFSATGLDIQGYILKPYSPSLLMEKVEAVLNARSRQGG